MNDDAGDSLELNERAPVPRDHALATRSDESRAIEHVEPKPSHERNGKPGEGAHNHEGPQLDLKPIGTLPIVLMAAGFAGLLVGLFVLGWIPHHRRIAKGKDEASKREDAKPIVSTTRPVAEKSPPTLTLPATARAFQSTAIYPRASGYLKRRLADIGDKVKAGQLLAEIETPEIDAQYAAAVAALEQARANVTRSANDLDLAAATLARYEGFAKSGGVTQQQLDEKRSARDQAQNALANANASAKAGEAELQRLTALQGFQKIYAPFDGTVTLRNYDVGALLSAGTGGTADGASGSANRALFQIDQTDTLRVFVDVPQSYAGAVRVGQRADFLVRNDPGLAFPGTIARTAGAIDEQTRTLRVEADLPNADGKLFPGMYGNLRATLKQDREPFVVPSSALVFGPEGTRVLVVQADNKIKALPVQIGRDLGTQLEISQGLTGEERVVANPGERLVDGVEVAIAEPKQQSARPAPGQQQMPQQPDGSPSGPDARQQAAAK